MKDRKPFNTLLILIALGAAFAQFILKDSITTTIILWLFVVNVMFSMIVFRKM